MGTSELYTENVNCGGLNHLASTCSRESNRAGTIFFGSTSTSSSSSSSVMTSSATPMEVSSTSSCSSTASMFSSLSSTSSPCLTTSNLEYDPTKRSIRSLSPSRSHPDPVDYDSPMKQDSMPIESTTASFPEENCENYAQNGLYYHSNTIATTSENSQIACNGATTTAPTHITSTNTNENTNPIIKLPSPQELLHHHQQELCGEQPSTNLATSAGGSNDRFPSLGHLYKHLETPVTRFLNKNMFGTSHPHTPPPPPAPSSPATFGSGARTPIGSPNTTSNNNNNNNNNHRSFTEASPDGAIHLPSLHLDAAKSSSRPIPLAPNRVPLRDNNNNNSSPRCALPHLDQAVVGSLPSLSSGCLGSLTPNRTPNQQAGRPMVPSFPMTSAPRELGHPLQYLRSVSCPSDAQNRPLPTRVDEPIAHLLQPEYLRRATSSILEVPKCPVERTSSLGPFSETRGIGNGSSSYFPNGSAFNNHSSSSSTSNSQPQGMDLHHWLANDRHPLNCLAESAQAMMNVERSNAENKFQPLQHANSSSPILGRDSSSHSTSSDGMPHTSTSSSGCSNEPKREKKLCGFPGCKSNAVTRGLCISHGGGRRCQRKGCTRGAQSKGLCVAHGGGRICRARGCTNIQRSMGLCIRHGGGKRCSVPGCDKGVVRQDLCTAHGGKRKCKVENCTKHVKKKGLCRSHANSVLSA